MKNEKVNLRFLIGVYLLLLGFIIIITTVVFAMYGNIATMKNVGSIEAQKAAVDNLGTLAQSFSDLIKVTVGAVIGALSATLQSLMSSKSEKSKDELLAHEDESQSNG